MINSAFTRYRVEGFSRTSVANNTVTTITRASLVTFELSSIGSDPQLYWSTSTSLASRFFVKTDTLENITDYQLTLFVPAGQPIRITTAGTTAGNIHIFELE